MGSKVNPDVVSSGTGGPTGADLNTDSVSGGFTPPSSGAGITTPGPDGFKVGRHYHEAPDAGIGNPAGSRVRWVRDNAPERRNDAEPSQMDPFEVLAGFVRAGDALGDMLTRGAVKAGTAEVVASADRTGEPSMAELTHGKDLFDVLGGFAGKANERLEDISKKPKA